MSNNNPLIIPQDPVLYRQDFERMALEIFRAQYIGNSIYRQYCDALKKDIKQVHMLSDIPFLPISFFKSHIVLNALGQDKLPGLVFESSGTTGEVPSRHYIADASVYRQSLLYGFEQFYGAVADWTILALLPSYLERKNASLVHMARVLMEESGHSSNGFYINEFPRLQQVIQSLEAAGQKTLLLGVTFALMDFAAAHPMQLQHTAVMETGGMKGRRTELTRTEVHDYLKAQWGLPFIHSEYGMTELLSQAYATGNGIFRSTDTMKVLVRDINDPLSVQTAGAGVLNIIDLANINSCSFIATEDLGTVYPDGSFEVLGRMDHSALRGCSLMVV